MRNAARRPKFIFCRSQSGGTMKQKLRQLATVLLLCTAVMCWAAQTTQAASSSGSANATPLVGPLVVPDVQPLVDGGGILAVFEVAHDSPSAVATRKRSQTAFENLDEPQAARAALTTFPGVLTRSAGGLPALPSGAKITGFATPELAQVALAGGDHGVIESSAPMVLRTRTGGWTPVDLQLQERPHGLSPARPVVGVEIPKHLSEGATLPTLKV